MPDSSKLSTIPVGQLGLLPLESCRSLGEKVDNYLVKWRKERLQKRPQESRIFDGYEQDTYILNSCCPRFASGEAKGTLQSSVRGKDIFIMVDVGNYSIEYTQSGI